jgi:hypothetical protein
MPLTVSPRPETRSPRVAVIELQAAAIDIGPPVDIVEEWGMQSFPASDPPANW